MGFLEQSFDIKDMPVAEDRDFAPIPAGWYTAAIVGAESKTTVQSNRRFDAACRGTRCDRTGSPALGV
jgi:hypothetical protein